MTSKTARQRRLAAKSSRKKRALRGPFCVWLSGRLPPGCSPDDSKVHNAGKTIHDALHPYCRQWPEDQLAGLARAFWRNSAPKNQNSSLNTYRYGSCAYSFSGGCSDQSYAFTHFSIYAYLNAICTKNALNMIIYCAKSFST